MALRIQLEYPLRIFFPHIPPYYIFFTTSLTPPQFFLWYTGHIILKWNKRMQTTGFAYGHIHDLCINTVQSVADAFEWGLGYGKLKPGDLQLLQSGAFGKLSWAWALKTYGVPDNQEIVDLSMRILGLDATFPGGAALCRIDKKRRRLEICMVENFLRDQDTPLTKRVWLSTLVFAHTLAKATKHDEIYVMNPVTQYLPLYRKFGFYEDVTCPPNLSSSLEEIEEAIRRAMSGML